MTRLLAVLLVVFAVAAPTQAEPVRAWEGTLDLPTYPWIDDPNPVYQEYEGRIYYPYTRQDHLLDEKVMRTYRALYLENEYLKITCLPELGGRIHSVWDKTTNEEMFHNPGVIKPALIAMRGAWIAGGIEWNVGPQGHTVTIVSPVDATIVKNDDGSATLVIGNTEKMFRTRWTVRVTLHPGKAYLDESIRMFNPTDGTHTYYFWNNTAFLNLDSTRFIYPMSLGSNHNGDEFFTWPVNDGVDMTYLKNYPTMASVFAYGCDQDFFGAYDVDLDRGIVSHANHHIVQGKKAWTWGEDDFGVMSQMGLTDGNREEAPYIEVQTGPLLTQADYGFLKPHEEISWREYWYPVHGLGDGFEFANRDVAVNAKREGGALNLALIATAEFTGARLTLSQGERVLAEKTLDLSPLDSHMESLADVPDGPIDITVRDSAGNTLLAYATPLAITPVDAPDLEGEAAWQKTLPEDTQLFMGAQLLDRKNRPEAAREKYEEVLAVSPGHVDALNALATLLLERGDYDGCIGQTKKAIRVDEESSDAWYLQGAAQLALGQADDAIVSGYKVVQGSEDIARGYSLVGRAKMLQKESSAAVAAFAEAHHLAPENSRYRDWWLAARYANGEAIIADLEPLRDAVDPTDFMLHALAAVADPAEGEGALAFWEQESGERVFTLMEVVTFFTNLGLYEEAATILEGARQTDTGYGPIPLLAHAWCQARAGDESGGATTLSQLEGMALGLDFPARPEMRPVLAWAAKQQPDSALVATLQGMLEAGLYNRSDAVAHWKTAVAQGGGSIPERLLGLDAWKVEKDLVTAAARYRKAIAASPEDQMLYRDLSQILAADEKKGEAIALLEGMPEAVPARFDIVLWRARAYVDEGRFDDCLSLLKNSTFTNFEGSTRPHDIFEDALLGRGKLRFKAGDLDGALSDFSEALTYPEYLEVGARYVLTDAELRYWQGKTLAKLGKAEEARAAWEIGAAQPTKDSPKQPYINVNDAQDLHVKKCVTALELVK